ncbi:MAG TPA: histidine kinase dimerization/phospho-acceptor domain-containing protein [Bacteroidales bacterium]|nr:histidine kinase dimerization/phospho-acceptor domain-containing protein [Bacteroidales bacterium]
MFDLQASNSNRSPDADLNPRPDAEQSAGSAHGPGICNKSLLAGLSRELRTNLNSVVAFTYLLNRSDNTGTEREQFSNHIHNACEQIISLFDNFLDSAIIDTGNSKSEAGKCNPAAFFKKLFEGFSEIMKNDLYRDIMFMPDSPDDKLPECYLDENRFARLSSILFRIALSNTSGGYIRTGCCIRDEILTFYILDSGQGFYKCREFFYSNDLTHSLIKFNDVPMAVSMILARKLASLMGCSMRIESNCLSGTGFFITVPVKAIREEPDEKGKYLNTLTTI